MQVNIIIFGQLTDITGTDILSLENVKDTGELIGRLKTAYPALNTSKFAIAVDTKIVKENTVLSNNDIIALLPPFSGG